MPLPLRVRISTDAAPEAARAALKEPGASVRVVGGTPALGNWDPKRSPALTRAAVEEDASIWEGTLDDSTAAPGTEFKYCVLVVDKHQYHWETAQAHRMPPPKDTAELEHFNGAVASASHGAPASHAKADEWKSLDASAELDLTADGEVECVDCFIPWQHTGTSSSSGTAPRSIFHAFHWPFAEVRKHLKDLHERGFDAIQISPAHKSKHGHEWWTRYQPKDYTKIEGLGSLEDLRNLCQDAQSLGVMIIADVVFNHMIVVASAHEWERAQQKPKELEKLKQKLTAAVAPTFTADDFQWPWFKMDGPHWDNENRYEGWGCGEWSELKYCPKVVDVHNRHLKDLLDAGVRGVRFDAVKHMRAEHVGEYLSFLRKQPFPVYAYGEVLSVDEKMQREYMEPLSMPTTDFALTVYLNDVAKKLADVKTVSEGARVAAARAAKAEGLGALLSGARPTTSPEAPALAADSVRFARNHDTVQNDGSFYGLGGSAIAARVVWAWLLAVNDGTVLMYPEDILDAKCAPVLTRALKFRSSAGARAERTEVCVRCTGKPGAKVHRPALVSIVLRNAEGGVEGLCLLNLLRDKKLRVGTVPLNSQAGGEEASLLSEDGSAVTMLADGRLVDDSGSPHTVLIPPWDGLFLVDAPF